VTGGALQEGIFAYAILSRLAYVLFVGWVLRREERNGFYAHRFGPAEGFRRFRRHAAFVMNHDAFAFILLCVVTRDTWSLPFPPAASFAAGAALIIAGLGTKFWAARTLGSEAYYWHNFFEPDAAIGPVSSGPYRFFSSPMYTIGYLQTYGLALLLRSFPGLIAAVFSQAAILTFYLLIEKPHFKRLHRSS
jgi:protein-S-isoprenylcysteine O-methyltransferase Ste14